MSIRYWCGWVSTKASSSIHGRDPLLPGTYMWERWWSLVVLRNLISVRYSVQLSRQETLPPQVRRAQNKIWNFSIPTNKRGCHKNWFETVIRLPSMLQIIGTRKDKTLKPGAIIRLAWYALHTSNPVFKKDYFWLGMTSKLSYIKRLNIHLSQSGDQFFSVTCHQEKHYIYINDD